ncbi:peroxiredoxin [Shimia sp.]|uniref:peroxiredoxin n=1 Tax=Shimia sp. TaxID=1954381 RepID=UPI0032985D47
MTIKPGEKLPAATLMKVGSEGPEPVDLAPLVEGRKVVMFGLPGAFTRTCSSAHLPSFMRTANAFKEKGVDEIICISVNDPFVMDAWDKSTGASDAGVTMLVDPAGEFVKSIGLDFSVPAIGFINRARRFAAVIDDGTVTTLNVEEAKGVCEISAGETLLATL